FALLQAVPDLHQVVVAHTGFHWALLDPLLALDVTESVAPTSQHRVHRHPQHVLVLLSGDPDLRIRPGPEAAQVRVDSFHDRPLRGRVKWVATVAAAADFLSSDVRERNRHAPGRA